MANRLNILKDNIKQKQNPQFVHSSFDYLQLSSFLTTEEQQIRINVRKFVESEVNPKIHDYVERAEFPEYLLQPVRKANFATYFFPAPYGKGSRTTLQGLILAQLARGDASVATMTVVQLGLLGYTVYHLGSEEQKKKYLPKIINFQLIGGWGLTEDKTGSDASNLKSTAVKISENQIKLNGTKRWIGTGNRDLLVFWAKNVQNKNIEGFLLQNKAYPNLKSQPIKHKLALRPIQNCHITLKDVIVTEQQRLPKAKDFQTGTNAVLMHSRVYVFWIAAGVAMGVYDRTIKYASERKQFGKSISGFQLTQLKLVNMMANIQGILLLCFRITKLAEEGKVTLGQIALCKAWITERGREITKLGRQIFGGNGIIHDNYVIKAMADMEGIYTYEGTYDINVLIAGRQLTGISAFK